VAGETGSGKTTQLPKMCLELGRAALVDGVAAQRIGHTQPRRIAARSVATRISAELETPLGETVGFAVRFTDQVGPATQVKLMTDGILLAEIQHDPLLNQYDTLIIDEAHERSLTIDFLLGYLRTLLPRRPDLRVIITSATIDPQRFSAHFGNAPIIEVSGRTYPVEVRYRPLVPDITESDSADRRPPPDRRPKDQIEGILDAVAELERESPGDVLVFLSGEREIRDTADALNALELPLTEIVPLYARLSTAEQQRVFSSHTGRRIVLATNVAETSLTVPGIRYVIDTGLARISRYSARTKVQRLPIEAISQASAGQRAGRCGRLSDGICIRLYSEADYNGRPEFTEPEILRTSLASVILRMAALSLGEVEKFGFLDPPEQRSIRDGVGVLYELGALLPNRSGAAGQPTQTLTPLGRSLARLPVDPRLGRMLLAASENGCAAEVSVIAAALSIQDPRERPTENQAAADQLHARFADDRSDFIAYLNLWNYLREQQQELSGNQFRRLCRSEYLHYLRIREWQDLVSQLRRVGRTIGIRSEREPAQASTIHAALLTGLLSQVGFRETDKREFSGPRNTRFVIAPGSALAKRPPRWVMAAELVETSRLFARTVARTDPETIEKLAGHLVMRSYSEPRWDRRRAAAVATERVTLYGLPLVTGRQVNFGRIDPAEARELFIQHALVEGQWDTRHEFLQRNADLIAEVGELEQRLRRRDVIVDDDALAEFFRQRIPADVISGAHFDRWWKRQDKHLLDFSRDLLLQADEDVEYPDEWSDGQLALPVTYRFEPGAPDDGVTVHVPLDVLNRVDPDGIAWPVAQRREELIVALLRALPKSIRRDLGPIPNVARWLTEAVPAGGQPLLPALERAILEETGVRIQREDWALERVPAHLRPGFVIEDADGRELARGKNLPDLRDQLGDRLRLNVAEAAPGLERSGLRAWNFGDLPRRVEQTRAGNVVAAFPTLVDDGDSVSIRVVPDEAEQARLHPGGVRRLLIAAIASPVKAATSGFTPRSRLALSRNPDGSLPDLVDDTLAAVVDALILGNGGPVWTAADFESLRATIAPVLANELAAGLRDVERVIEAIQELDLAWPPETARRYPEAALDIATQRNGLLYKGFVTGAGRNRLRNLARYVQAITRRVEKLPREPDVDSARMARVHQVEEAYRESARHQPPERLQAVRWMIEELRVSLFAQQLGTPEPVSEKRIYRAMDAVAS
jgi:ATP-dependent helicase HrpA